MGKTAYRTLSLAEIDALEAQGCSAEDWQKITVATEFTTDGIGRCRFKGEVSIGARTTIFNIGSHIANYEIGDDVCIENVGVIETVGESSFGNGTAVETINENGGRTVKIFDTLTAQMAYVAALYRHRPESVEAIGRIAEAYAAKVRNRTGRIGQGARITNSNIIRNVRIGPAAEIEGVTILSNGSVLSTPAAPTVIGAGVKMYDFIVADGTEIENDTLLKRCFVGQNVKLDNLTATNSLFFANSHFENCEACSIFSGPFTVSHHKSSLLIAGMFSFFNAGSGTNQSNHLFKTGAVHQGIHQRGCKFASNGYVMLPCKNGAFTVIIGRHRSHADTENFPYSYLIENNEQSFLIPGQNLSSFGTVRDIDKWAKRDARKGPKNDNVNFEECNPYVGERMRNAVTILSGLLEDDEPEVYNWGRMKIKSTSAARGLKLYGAAMTKFIGAMLSEGKADRVDGSGHWIDCAGQYMPSSAMNAILDNLESGRTATPEALAKEFETVMGRYADYACNWALDVLRQELGHEPSDDDINASIARGNRAERLIKELTDSDKERDFDAMTMVGYGIDATDEQEQKADFDAVRR